MQGSIHTSEQDQARREDANKVLDLVSRLRKITLAVQIAPFVYTALYIFSMIMYLVASEAVCVTLDLLFYVSPVVIIIFLYESKLLKLCKWHKTARVLPAIPIIPIVIDEFFYEFTVWAFYANIITILLMSTLLLVAAYKVFFS